jgi:predicted transcriptional regulator of viral defense system
MNFLNFEKLCKSHKCTLFTVSDLKVLFRESTLEYLRVKLSRWKQKGYIQSLKRGLYMLPEAHPDEFEIASRLITPSYISLETALSHYSIIPDISARVSSITTKNTRKFLVEKTEFSFHHIRQSLFTGFVHLRDDIFVASPEKALLDFLYFRRPDEDHPFFERVNCEATRMLDLKLMNKLSLEFPSYTQKLYNHLQHALIK